MKTEHSKRAVYHDTARARRRFSPAMCRGVTCELGLAFFDLITAKILLGFCVGFVLASDWVVLFEA